jgi:hypothetical protein
MLMDMNETTEQNPWAAQVDSRWTLRPVLVDSHWILRPQLIDSPLSDKKTARPAMDVRAAA